MEDLTQAGNARSRVLQHVQLRRGGQIIKDVPVKTLVAGIKIGKLRRTDEFSSDGHHWTPLSKHHQLSNLFSDTEPAAPKAPLHVEKEFVKLADMIRDINK